MQGSIALVLAVLVAAATPVRASEPPRATLVAFAKLRANTFRPGPTAGAHHGPGALAGHAGPYLNKQPVQGISGAVADGEGTYTVISDNGFGTIDTSADYRLALYKLRPHWGGGVDVARVTPLTDPRRMLPWTLTHQFGSARPLTGVDLDPESIVRSPDGTYWIGDEFGPFLVHVDAAGAVLSKPVPLPGVRSAQSPYSEETAALRFLNALRAHGERYGAKPTALSPWYPFIPGGSERPIVDLKALHTAGFAVVPWTVNDRATMDRLLKAGVDGLISDRPDLLLEAVAAHDANGDGRPGDFLDADGNIDGKKFNAEGHRGARNLRPESTLPAFEAALDLGMTTLETDCGISRDGVPMLSHDPHLETTKTRRLDGRTLFGVGPAIHAHDAAYLQGTFDRGLTLPDRPLQTLDLSLSPVSTLYASAEGLRTPYALLRLDQLFGFVRAYEAYYRRGGGQGHPEARKRANAAARVRFDLETKITPLDERAGLTPTPEVFAQTLAITVAQAGLNDRTTIQSFDYRTLLAIQRSHPALATSFLLEDALPFGMRDSSQPTDARPMWPWRVTSAVRPHNVLRSGGYESLGASPDGRYLYGLLEKPLIGEKTARLRLDEFDTQKHRWTGRGWFYPWEAAAKSVADLVMVNRTQGLTIERDDGEGAEARLKRLYMITLGKPGTTVRKELLVDLMNIQDPRHLGGKSSTFSMPFWTIEAIVVLDARHVLILNDNNYPFSGGRKAGVPDDDEFAVLELPKPLPLPASFKPVAWR